VLGDVAKHPVTERPARTVEDGIRRAADDPVDDEAAPLLERLDRVLDALVEDGLAEAVRVARPAREVAGEHEPLAHGCHGRA
jgi:hypothetical protein